MVPGIFVDVIQLFLQREREVGDGADVTHVAVRRVARQARRCHVRRPRRLDLLQARKSFFR